jgi:8-oxo-dGTP pyrophosphatase MutT (NUDIX family)
MGLPYEAQAKKVLEGAWDENLRWEFHLSSHIPPAELCTAIACIAIDEPSDRIVLTRNQRGWEILGGHIEPGETATDALFRETREEGGFRPQRFNPFGYRKVIARQPVPHDQREGYYPFPISYIPHFVAASSLALSAPTGEEILESRAFSLHEIETLGVKTLPIIQAGVYFYRYSQR